MKTRMMLVLAVVALSLSGQAYAAGFALIEQSVKGLGTAFSGGAASAEDASTVFFNPAGMTRLEGTQTTAGIHVIVPQAHFSSSSATVPKPPYGTGAPITGAGGNGANLKPVPNAYLTHNLGNGLVFGLGVNAPFGMATEFDRGWVGRYHAVESDVKTLNINPSVAYKVSDNLSIGGGVNAQYLEATLSSMIFTAAGDVYSKVKADDWGVGFNAGVLLSTTDGDSRLGVSYRSKVDQHLKGTANFTTPVPVAPLFPKQSVSGDISLPASAQVSIYHRFSPEWAVMGDAMWTDWSTFDVLTINFDKGVGPGLATKKSTTQEHWQDNGRYSVGATFNPSPELTLRSGVALDETPIPDAYRTPRIPGNDRYWVAFGAGYAKDQWAVDLGYAHLFVKNGDVNLDFDPSRGDLIGSFDNSVDIISAEMSYKF